MFDVKLQKDIQALVKCGWRLPDLLYVFSSFTGKKGVTEFIEREYKLFWAEKRGGEKNAI